MHYTDSIDELFDNRYHIISPIIPQGQNARVYLALDEVTGLQVALKIMYISQTHLDTLFNFRTIVNANASCEHVRVIKISDYGITQERIPFICMEYLDTPSLEIAVQQRGQLQLGEIEWVAVWVAEALAYLHNHQILHLDLSSRNILLDENVGIKVADAGLRSIDLNRRIITGEGLSIRNISTLAPEQLLSQSLTYATDVFAFGVIIFKLLTGKYPYPESTLAQHLEILSNSLIDKPPRPSNYVDGIPPYLDDLVMRCLYKNPILRPKNGWEVYMNLKAGMQS